LSYPSTELPDTNKARLNYKLYEIVKQSNPDTVYTHYNKELNESHSIVSNGTLVACRPDFYKGKILMYESESTLGFKPNYHVDIEEFIDVKCQAFSFYESEVKEYPHQRSIEGIINHAKYRGNEVGLKFAEAFYLVRDIWREEF